MIKIRLAAPAKGSTNAFKFSDSGHIETYMWHYGAAPTSLASWWYTSQHVMILSLIYDNMWSSLNMTWSPSLAQPIFQTNTCWQMFIPTWNRQMDSLLESSKLWILIIKTSCTIVDHSTWRNCKESKNHLPKTTFHLMLLSVSHSVTHEHSTIRIKA